MMKLKDLLEVCDKETQIDVWRNKDELFLGDYNNKGICPDPIHSRYYECEVVKVLGSGAGGLIDVVIMTGAQED